MDITRRRFIETAAVAGLASALPVELKAATPPAKGRVVVVKRADRAAAVAACFEGLAFKACEGRDVTIKANYNSDDAFPASTHPETVKAMLAELRKRGAAGMTLAERSGMGDTARVLERTGAAEVVRAAGGRVVVLDAIDRDQWRAFKADHWSSGFHAARLFADAPCAVQTMCCKTHRFGGHVTLSLKNTVGLVAKRLPGDGHDYMNDLHHSAHQRAMIAEANLAWRPAINVMDCLEAFVDGGPDRGERVSPGVFLASDDRCALDAAALALLRLHGMQGPAANGAIGGTDQLARALALGIGAAPRNVEVLAVDAGARDVATRIADLLAAG